MSNFTTFIDKNINKISKDSMKKSIILSGPRMYYTNKHGLFIVRSLTQNDITRLGYSYNLI